VITPAGWMNAGNADFLREQLSSELTLEELFLFGSYKLFAADQGPAPTPTVESAILVATKAPAPKGHKLRVVALEDEAAVAGRAELLAEMARRASAKGGRRGGIHAHSIAQVDLRPEYPWPVKFGRRDVAAQVVARLTGALADPAEPIEPLVGAWKIFQGIQTGADAYTKRIEKRLIAVDRSELDRKGVAIGEAVLEISRAATRESPWREHPHVLVKSPESRGLLYGAIDDDYTYLIVARKEPHRDVLDHLERFRPILSTRAEIARNPRRKWWEAAWPRDEGDLRSPKVIALYRTDRGRFALDEDGEWQPSIKSTVVVGREEKAPVAYLCGLLNSELLDLWYAVRGKTPRDVWRNYEPKRMNEMPYRRPEGDPRAEEIAELVREIAANRRALLPHRSVVRDLGRIVKDPWKSGPVAIDRPALVAELGKGDSVSVRLDPGLEIEGKPAGKSRREKPDVLAFRRGGAETGRVVGDPERLELLVEIVGARSIDDPGSVLLPKDLDSFDQLAQERARTVSELLADGRRKVEQVERLVCTLYGLPDELTEAVVQHAVERAAR